MSDTPTIGDITSGDDPLASLAAELGIDLSGAQQPFEGLLPEGVTPSTEFETQRSDFIPGVPREQTLATAVRRPMVTNEFLQSIFTGTTSVRARWLGELANAGLLTGPVDPQLWTEDYSGLLTDLARLANGNGISLQEAIRGVGQLRARQDAASGRGRGGGGGAGRAIPVYRPPDPATLRQTVRATMRQELGRDPLPEELRDLTSSLQSDFLAQFDAAVAEGEQVDPVARFEEDFAERFSPEKDLLQSRDEFAQGQAAAGQATSLVDQMIRAGGV